MMEVLAKITRGALAQLARAPALQAGGPGFESPTLHHTRGKSGENLFLLHQDALYGIMGA
jgi:hypothetical protein